MNDTQTDLNSISNEDKSKYNNSKQNSKQGLGVLLTHESRAFKIQTRDIFNIQPTRQVSFKTIAKHTHVLSNGLTL